MALRELPSTFGRLLCRDARPLASSISRRCRRDVSTAASQELSEDIQELESQSSLAWTDSSAENANAFDPIKRAKGRKQQLPPSR